MKNILISVAATLMVAALAATVQAQPVVVNPDALKGLDAPAAKPKPKAVPAKPLPVVPAKPIVKTPVSATTPPTVVPVAIKPASKPPVTKPIVSKPAIVTAPSAPPPVLVAAPPASGAQRDREDLARVSAYLNTVRSLQGSFVQVGPNGEIDQGTIYVNKPGRMRFEYAKPSPYLIVADGVSVAVGNSEVKTVDRYPLIENPLSMILDDQIDLIKTGGVTRVERKPGQLIVSAKREQGALKGQVTLIFASPTLELRQWVVTDVQGLQTMITLQNVQTGVTLNPELFILRDVNKFADPRE